MSTRPTLPIPTWSTAGTNIEPSSGKKSQGWVVNERPPAEWLNWLQNSAGAWLQFLADVTNGAPTADLKLNFANTDMFAPLIDVTTAPPASGFRLLQRVLVGGTQHVNVYAGNATRRLVFTYNATWGGSSWLCENSGQGASALALLGDGSQTTLELLWHAATGGTWGDASWGRGNILVNTFTAAGLSATGGTFTNLTVTQDLTVQRDAIVTRDVTVGNNITVTHDIAAEDIVGNTLRSLGQTLVFGPLTVQSDKLQLYQPVDIVYDAVLGQPIRKVQIPLMSGVEHGGNISSTNGYDQSAGYLHTAPGIDRVFEYTFMIPRGCVSWNLEMLQMSPDSGHANNLVVLKSNRDMDAPTSTPGAIATMGSRTVGSFSGTNAIPVALSLPITELVDPYNNTYFARIGIKGNAAGTNRLYGVRLVYNDPGARNG